MRRILLLTILLNVTASPGFAAGIEPNQTRPERPLVLNPGAADLHVGFAFDIVGEPELDAFNTVRLPIGADFGVASGLEVGLLLDTTLHSEFSTSLSLRGRFGFNEFIGVGLMTTLPLGYLTWRLGPEALPLTVEAPVLRLEGTDAAIQAALRWNYTIQEGDDGKGMDAGVAGIFRIGRSAFFLLETGIDLPEFETAGFAVPLGAGFGLFVTENFVAKVQAQTPDLTELNTFEVLFMVVNTSGSKAKQHSSDWL